MIASINKLFNLIQTLSKTEKGYFKRWVLRNKRNAYPDHLILFDLLSQETKLNKEKIVQKFKKKRSTKYLAQLNTYLYNELLQCLSNYHSEVTIEMVLYQYLSRIDILYNKSLYAQCLEILEKGKTLAKQYDKHDLLLSFLDWEFRVKIYVETSTRATEPDKDYNNMNYPEYDSAMKAYNNILTFRILAQKIFKLYRLSVMGNRDISIKKEMNTLLKHPLLQSEENALTSEAKNLYYNIHGCIANMENNTKKEYELNKKTMLLTELDLKLRYNRNKVKYYIVTLHNIAISLIDLKYFQSLEKVLIKLRDLRTRNRDLQRKALSFYYNLQLYANIKQGLFANGINDIEITIRNPEKVAKYVTPEYELEFLLMIAVSYVGNDQFEESILWLNHILTVKKITAEYEIYTRILQMIAHYELGHNIYLESFILNFERFLNKNRIKYELEAIIMSYMKKLNLAKSNSEKQKLLHHFKQQLLTKKFDSNEEGILHYFDIVSWIESKILKKPLSSIIKGNIRVQQNP